MGIHIGIDIGSVSVKLVAIGTGRNCFESLVASKPQYRLEPFLLDGQSAWCLYSPYRRVLGNPYQAVAELLGEVLNDVGPERAVGLRLTGSGGESIAASLESPFENEFCCVARAMRQFHPAIRGVIEIGGGSSTYLELRNDVESRHLGITDYQTSGDCAAGTGSFIEQQATRLLYKVEEIGPVACEAPSAARVAGRCSVFAKSDMIHAQQKGFSTAQILRGLCDAVARNFKSTIVSGRKLATPVAFIGGVANNDAVRKAIRETFQLTEEQLIVPRNNCWMGAIGAALADCEKQTSFTRAKLLALEHASAKEDSSANWKPLNLNNVILLRNVKERVARQVDDGSRHDTYLGIDIGSVSTNLVVIDENGVLLKEIYLPTQGRPIEVVDAGLREIQSELGDRINIRGVGTTGSGRELVGELVGADVVRDEITAHKTGSVHVCRQLGIEMVDTIFEIGGQDSKYIRIDNGVVVDFTMNEACAAGTGSFLEEQAEKLGVQIKGEFAKLALASTTPARVGERCTVFMERDLSGLMMRGAAVGDLCAGLAYSVALNYLNRVVRGRKIGNVIFFQGGTAYNDAVAAAFSQILRKRIIVPPHNGVIGAIGMALAARDQMQHGGTSRFRGYDLRQVNFTTRDFTCRACSNFCEMKEFSIEGERSYWGDKCSDKFRKRARAVATPVIPDLFAFREERLESVLKPTHHARKIGIPRAMYYFDRFPFWCTYIQELGFDVVLSPKTDGKIASSGQSLAVAQPCFPVQVAHGHVRALLDEGVDHVLVPNICDGESDDKTDSQLCPWNQTLPFMVKAARDFERDASRVLTPTVHFRMSRKSVAKQLRTLATMLGVSGRISDRACDAAFAAQDGFRDSLLEQGKAVLKLLEDAGASALVIVGRPYNIYDSTVNCDIPRKLRSMYGVNVIPLDFLPFDREEVSDINPNMYWISGQRILRAARFTSHCPNLHLLYISNFKCGPDSYIKPYTSDASGRPGLVLQFDGHSNDAGFVTRCEAYLHSKGFLQ